MLTQTGRSETAIFDAAAGCSLRLDPDDVERLAAAADAWYPASSRVRVLPNIHSARGARPSPAEGPSAPPSYFR